MCKMYKFVNICKNSKIRVFQVIHTKIEKKGGKINVLKNLSTLSTQNR